MHENSALLANVFMAIDKVRVPQVFALEELEHGNNHAPWVRPEREHALKENAK